MKNSIIIRQLNLYCHNNTEAQLANQIIQSEIDANYAAIYNISHCAQRPSF